LNVTGSNLVQPVVITEASALLLSVSELLDANPFEELFPYNSSVPASMSPNVVVLVAKSELQVVFATELEIADSFKYSSVMIPPPYFLRSLL